jgi:hypothetical protein
MLYVFQVNLFQVCVGKRSACRRSQSFFLRNTAPGTKVFFKIKYVFLISKIMFGIPFSVMNISRSIRIK